MSLEDLDRPVGKSEEPRPETPVAEQPKAEPQAPDPARPDPVKLFRADFERNRAALEFLAKS